MQGQFSNDFGHHGNAHSGLGHMNAGYGGIGVGGGTYGPSGGNNNGRLMVNDDGTISGGAQQQYPFGGMVVGMGGGVGTVALDGSLSATMAASLSNGKLGGTTSAATNASDTHYQRGLHHNAHLPTSSVEALLAILEEHFALQLVAASSVGTVPSTVGLVGRPAISPTTQVPPRFMDASVNGTNLLGLYPTTPSVMMPLANNGAFPTSLRSNEPYSSSGNGQPASGGGSNPDTPDVASPTTAIVGDAHGGFPVLNGHGNAATANGAAARTSRQHTTLTIGSSSGDAYSPTTLLSNATHGSPTTLQYYNNNVSVFVAALQPTRCALQGQRYELRLSYPIQLRRDNGLLMSSNLRQYAANADTFPTSTYTVQNVPVPRHYAENCLPHIISGITSRLVDGAAVVLGGQQGHGSSTGGAGAHNNKGLTQANAHDSEMHTAIANLQLGADGMPSSATYREQQGGATGGNSSAPTGNTAADGSPLGMASAGWMSLIYDSSTSTRVERLNEALLFSLRRITHYHFQTLLTGHATLLPLDNDFGILPTHLVLGCAGEECVRNRVHNRNERCDTIGAIPPQKYAHFAAKVIPLSHASLPATVNAGLTAFKAFVDLSNQSTASEAMPTGASGAPSGRVGGTAPAGTAAARGAAGAAAVSLVRDGPAYHNLLLQLFTILLKGEAFEVLLRLISICARWRFAEQNVRATFLFRFIRACLPSDYAPLVELAMKAWKDVYEACVKIDGVCDAIANNELMTKAVEWLILDTPPSHVGIAKNGGKTVTALIIIRHLMGMFPRQFVVKMLAIQPTKFLEGEVLAVGGTNGNGDDVTPLTAKNLQHLVDLGHQLSRDPTALDDDFDFSTIANPSNHLFSILWNALKDPRNPRIRDLAADTLHRALQLLIAEISDVHAFPTIKEAVLFPLVAQAVGYLEGKVVDIRAVGPLGPIVSAFHEDPDYRSDDESDGDDEEPESPFNRTSTRSVRMPSSGPRARRNSDTSSVSSHRSFRSRSSSAAVRSTFSTATYAKAKAPITDASYHAATLVLGIVMNAYKTMQSRVNTFMTVATASTTVMVTRPSQVTGMGLISPEQPGLISPNLQPMMGGPMVPTLLSPASMANIAPPSSLQPFSPGVGDGADGLLLAESVCDSISGVGGMPSSYSSRHAPSSHSGGVGGTGRAFPYAGHTPSPAFMQRGAPLPHVHPAAGSYTTPALVATTTAPPSLTTSGTHHNYNAASMLAIGITPTEQNVFGVSPERPLNISHGNSTGLPNTSILMGGPTATEHHRHHHHQHRQILTPLFADADLERILKVVLAHNPKIGTQTRLAGIRILPLIVGLCPAYFAERPFFEVPPKTAIPTLETLLSTVVRNLELQSTGAQKYYLLCAAAAIYALHPQHANPSHFSLSQQGDRLLGHLFRLLVGRQRLDLAMLPMCWFIETADPASRTYLTRHVLAQLNSIFADSPMTPEFSAGLQRLCMAEPAILSAVQSQLIRRIEDELRIRDRFANVGGVPIVGGKGGYMLEFSGYDRNAEQNNNANGYGRRGGILARGGAGRGMGSNGSPNAPPMPSLRMVGWSESAGTIETKLNCFRILQHLKVQWLGSANFFINVCLPYFNHPSRLIRHECVKSCLKVVFSEDQLHGAASSNTKVTSLLAFHLINVAMTDPAEDIRFAALTALNDPRMNANLYHNVTVIDALFSIIKDESCRISNLAVEMIHQISQLNPTGTLPRLRKALLEQLSEVQHAAMDANSSSLISDVLLDRVLHVMEAAPVATAFYIRYVVSVLHQVLLHMDTISPAAATVSMRMLTQVFNLASEEEWPLFKPFVGIILAFMERIEKDLNRFPERFTLFKVFLLPALEALSCVTQASTTGCEPVFDRLIPVLHRLLLLRTNTVSQTTGARLGGKSNSTTNGDGSDRELTVSVMKMIGAISAIDPHQPDLLALHAELSGRSNSMAKLTAERSVFNPRIDAVPHEVVHLLLQKLNTDHSSAEVYVSAFEALVVAMASPTLKQHRHAYFPAVLTVLAAAMSRSYLLRERAFLFLLKSVHNLFAHVPNTRDIRAILSLCRRFWNPNEPLIVSRIATLVRTLNPFSIAIHDYRTWFTTNLLHVLSQYCVVPELRDASINILKTIETYHAGSHHQEGLLFLVVPSLCNVITAAATTTVCCATIKTLMLIVNRMTLEQLDGFTPRIVDTILHYFANTAEHRKRALAVIATAEAIERGEERILARTAQSKCPYGGFTDAEWDIIQQYRKASEKSNSGFFSRLLFSKERPTLPTATATVALHDAIRAERHNVYRHVRRHEIKDILQEYRSGRANMDRSRIVSLGLPIAVANRVTWISSAEHDIISLVCVVAIRSCREQFTDPMSISMAMRSLASKAVQQQHGGPTSRGRNGPADIPAAVVASVLSDTTSLLRSNGVFESFYGTVLTAIYHRFLHTKENPFGPSWLAKVVATRDKHLGNVAAECAEPTSGNQKQTPPPQQQKLSASMSVASGLGPHQQFPRPTSPSPQSSDASRLAAYEQSDAVLHFSIPAYTVQVMDLVTKCKLKVNEGRRLGRATTRKGNNRGGNPSSRNIDDAAAASAANTIDDDLTAILEDHDVGDFVEIKVKSPSAPISNLAVRPSANSPFRQQQIRTSDAAPTVGNRASSASAAERYAHHPRSTPIAIVTRSLAAAATANAAFALLDASKNPHNNSNPKFRKRSLSASLGYSQSPRATTFVRYDDGGGNNTAGAGVEGSGAATITSRTNYPPLARGTSFVTVPPSQPLAASFGGISAPTPINTGKNSNNTTTGGDDSSNGGVVSDESFSDSHPVGASLNAIVGAGSFGYRGEVGGGPLGTSQNPATGRPPMPTSLNPLAQSRHSFAVGMLTSTSAVGLAQHLGLGGGGPNSTGSPAARLMAAASPLTLTGFDRTAAQTYLQELNEVLKLWRAADQQTSQDQWQQWVTRLTLTLLKSSPLESLKACHALCEIDYSFMCSLFPAAQLVMVSHLKRLCIGSATNPIVVQATTVINEWCEGFAKFSTIAAQKVILQSGGQGQQSTPSVGPSSASNMHPQALALEGPSSATSALFGKGHRFQANNFSASAQQSPLMTAVRMGGGGRPTPSSIAARNGPPHSNRLASADVLPHFPSTLGPAAVSMAERPPEAVVPSLRLGGGGPQSPALGGMPRPSYIFSPPPDPLAATFAGDALSQFFGADPQTQQAPQQAQQQLMLTPQQQSSLLHLPYDILAEMAKAAHYIQCNRDTLGHSVNAVSRSVVAQLARGALLVPVAIFYYERLVEDGETHHAPLLLEMYKQALLLDDGSSLRYVMDTVDQGTHTNDALSGSWLEGIGRTEEAIAFYAERLVNARNKGIKARNAIMMTSSTTAGMDTMAPGSVSHTLHHLSSNTTTASGGGGIPAESNTSVQPLVAPQSPLALASPTFGVSLTSTMNEPTSNNQTMAPAGGGSVVGSHSGIPAVVSSGAGGVASRQNSGVVTAVASAAGGLLSASESVSSQRPPLPTRGNNVSRKRNQSTMGNLASSGTDAMFDQTSDGGNSPNAASRVHSAQSKESHQQQQPPQRRKSTVASNAIAVSGESDRDAVLGLTRCYNTLMNFPTVLKLYRLTRYHNGTYGNALLNFSGGGGGGSASDGGLGFSQHQQHHMMSMTIEHTPPLRPNDDSAAASPCASPLLPATREQLQQQQNCGFAPPTSPTAVQLVRAPSNLKPRGSRLVSIDGVQASQHQTSHAMTTTTASGASTGTMSTAAAPFGEHMISTSFNPYGSITRSFAAGPGGGLMGARHTSGLAFGTREASAVRYSGKRSSVVSFSERTAANSVFGAMPRVAMAHRGSNGTPPPPSSTIAADGSSTTTDNKVLSTTGVSPSTTGLPPAPPVLATFESSIAAQAAFAAVCLAQWDDVRDIAKTTLVPSRLGGFGICRPKLVKKGSVISASGGITTANGAAGNGGQVPFSLLEIDVDAQNVPLYDGPEAAEDKAEDTMANEYLLRHFATSRCDHLHMLFGTAASFIGAGNFAFAERLLQCINDHLLDKIVLFRAQSEFHRLDLNSMFQRLFELTEGLQYLQSSRTSSIRVNSIGQRTLPPQAPHESVISWVSYRSVMLPIHRQLVNVVSLTNRIMRDGYYERAIVGLAALSAYHPEVPTLFTEGYRATINSLHDPESLASISTTLSETVNFACDLINVLNDGGCGDDDAKSLVLGGVTADLVSEYPLLEPSVMQKILSIVNGKEVPTCAPVLGTAGAANHGSPLDSATNDANRLILIPHSMALPSQAGLGNTFSRPVAAHVAGLVRAELTLLQLAALTKVEAVKNSATLRTMLERYTSRNDYYANSLVIKTVGGVSFRTLAPAASDEAVMVRYRLAEGAIETYLDSPPLFNELALRLFDILEYIEDELKGDPTAEDDDENEAKNEAANNNDDTSTDGSSVYLDPSDPVVAEANARKKRNAKLKDMATQVVGAFSKVIRFGTANYLSHPYFVNFAGATNASASADVGAAFAASANPFATLKLRDEGQKDSLFLQYIRDFSGNRRAVCAHKITQLTHALLKMVHVSVSILDSYKVIDFSNAPIHLWCTTGPVWVNMGASDPKVLERLRLMCVNSLPFLRHMAYHFVSYFDKQPKRPSAGGTLQQPSQQPSVPTSHRHSAASMGANGPNSVIPAVFVSGAGRDTPSRRDSESTTVSAYPATANGGPREPSDHRDEGTANTPSNANPAAAGATQPQQHKRGTIYCGAGDGVEPEFEDGDVEWEPMADVSAMTLCSNAGGDNGTTRSGLPSHLQQSRSTPLPLRHSTQSAETSDTPRAGTGRGGRESLSESMKRRGGLGGAGRGQLSGTTTNASDLQFGGSVPQSLNNNSRLLSTALTSPQPRRAGVEKDFLRPPIPTNRSLASLSTSPSDSVLRGRANSGKVTSEDPHEGLDDGYGGWTADDLAALGGGAGNGGQTLRSQNVSFGPPQLPPQRGNSQQRPQSGGGRIGTTTSSTQVSPQHGLQSDQRSDAATPLVGIDASNSTPIMATQVESSDDPAANLDARNGGRSRADSRNTAHAVPRAGSISVDCAPLSPESVAVAATPASLSHQASNSAVYMAHAFNTGTPVALSSEDEDEDYVSVSGSDDGDTSKGGMGAAGLSSNAPIKSLRGSLLVTPLSRRATATAARLSVVGSGLSVGPDGQLSSTPLAAGSRSGLGSSATTPPLGVMPPLSNNSFGAIPLTARLSRKESLLTATQSNLRGRTSTVPTNSPGRGASPATDGGSVPPQPPSPQQQESTQAAHYPRRLHRFLASVSHASRAHRHVVQDVIAMGRFVGVSNGPLMTLKGSRCPAPQTGSQLSLAVAAGFVESTYGNASAGKSQKQHGDSDDRNRGAGEVNTSADGVDGDAPNILSPADEVVDVNGRRKSSLGTHTEATLPPTRNTASDKSGPRGQFPTRKDATDKTNKCGANGARGGAGATSHNHELTLSFGLPNVLQVSRRSIGGSNLYVNEVAPSPVNAEEQLIRLLLSDGSVMTFVRTIREQQRTSHNVTHASGYLPMVYPRNAAFLEPFSQTVEMVKPKDGEEEKSASNPPTATFVGINSPTPLVDLPSTAVPSPTSPTTRTQRRAARRNRKAAMVEALIETLFGDGSGAMPVTGSIAAESEAMGISTSANVTPTQSIGGATRRTSSNQSCSAQQSHSSPNRRSGAATPAGDKTRKNSGTASSASGGAVNTQQPTGGEKKPSVSLKLALATTESSMVPCESRDLRDRLQNVSALREALFSVLLQSLPLMHTRRALRVPISHTVILSQCHVAPMRRIPHANIATVAAGGLFSNTNIHTSFAPPPIPPAVGHSTAISRGVSVAPSLYHIVTAHEEAVAANNNQGGAMMGMGPFAAPSSTAQTLFVTRVALHLLRVKRPNKRASSRSRAGSLNALNGTTARHRAASGGIKAAAQGMTIRVDSADSEGGLLVPIGSGGGVRQQRSRSGAYSPSQLADSLPLAAATFGPKGSGGVSIVNSAHTGIAGLRSATTHSFARTISDGSDALGAARVASAGLEEFGSGRIASCQGHSGRGGPYGSPSHAFSTKPVFSVPSTPAGLNPLSPTESRHHSPLPFARAHSPLRRERSMVIHNGNNSTSGPLFDVGASAPTDITGVVEVVESMNTAAASRGPMLGTTTPTMESSSPYTNLQGSNTTHAYFTSASHRMHGDDGAGDGSRSGMMMMMATMDGTLDDGPQANSPTAQQVDHDNIADGEFNGAASLHNLNSNSSSVMMLSPTNNGRSGGRNREITMASTTFIGGSTSSAPNKGAPQMRPSVHQQLRSHVASTAQQQTALQPLQTTDSWVNPYDQFVAEEHRFMDAYTATLSTCTDKLGHADRIRESMAGSIFNNTTTRLRSSPSRIASGFYVDPSPNLVPMQGSAEEAGDISHLLQLSPATATTAQRPAHPDDNSPPSTVYASFGLGDTTGGGGGYGGIGAGGSLRDPNNRGQLVAVALRDPSLRLLTKRTVYPPHPAELPSYGSSMVPPPVGPFTPPMNAASAPTNSAPLSSERSGAGTLSEAQTHSYSALDGFSTARPAANTNGTTTLNSARPADNNENSVSTNQPQQSFFVKTVASGSEASSSTQHASLLAFKRLSEASSAAGAGHVGGTSFSHERLGESTSQQQQQHPIVEGVVAITDSEDDSSICSSPTDSGDEDARGIKADSSSNSTLLQPRYGSPPGFAHRTATGLPTPEHNTNNRPRRHLVAERPLDISTPPSGSPHQQDLQAHDDATDVLSPQHLSVPRTNIFDCPSPLTPQQHDDGEAITSAGTAISQTNPRPIRRRRKAPAGASSGGHNVPTPPGSIASTGGGKVAEDGDDDESLFLTQQLQDIIRAYQHLVKLERVSAVSNERAMSNASNALQEKFLSDATCFADWLSARTNYSQQLAEWSVLQYLFGVDIASRDPSRIFVDGLTGNMSHIDVGAFAMLPAPDNCFSYPIQHAMFGGGEAAGPLGTAPLFGGFASIPLVSPSATTDGGTHRLVGFKFGDHDETTPKRGGVVVGGATPSSTDGRSPNEATVRTITQTPPQLHLDSARGSRHATPPPSAAVTPTRRPTAAYVSSQGSAAGTETSGDDASPPMGAGGANPHAFTTSSHQIADEETALNSTVTPSASAIAPQLVGADSVFNRTASAESGVAVGSSAAAAAARVLAKQKKKRVWKPLNAYSLNKLLRSVLLPTAPHAHLGCDRSAVPFRLTPLLANALPLRSPAGAFVTYAAELLHATWGMAADLEGIAVYGLGAMGKKTTLYANLQTSGGNHDFLHLQQQPPNNNSFLSPLISSPAASPSSTQYGGLYNSPAICCNNTNGSNHLHAHQYNPTNSDVVAIHATLKFFAVARFTTRLRLVLPLEQRGNLPYTFVSESAAAAAMSSADAAEGVAGAAGVGEDGPSGAASVTTSTKGRGVDENAASVGVGGASPVGSRRTSTPLDGRRPLSPLPSTLAGGGGGSRSQHSDGQTTSASIIGGASSDHLHQQQQQPTICSVDELVDNARGGGERLYETQPHVMAAIQRGITAANSSNNTAAVGGVKSGPAPNALSGQVSRVPSSIARRISLPPVEGSASTAATGGGSSGGGTASMPPTPPSDNSNAASAFADACARFGASAPANTSSPALAASLLSDDVVAQQHAYGLSGASAATIIPQDPTVSPIPPLCSRNDGGEGSEGGAPPLPRPRTAQQFARALVEASTNPHLIAIADWGPEPSLVPTSAGGDWWSSWAPHW